MTSTPTRPTFRQILYNYWGYDDFRGIQKEIIESIAAGRDTLGLMPTGGGKSITFQVPALAMDGVCIVVTPLISLMRDQVMQLRRRGILASAIYSGMDKDEILITLENCILGQTKLLYISPERISSPLFITKAAHINVSLITVDEAHCISQWGHDFRPSYLTIPRLRELHPNAPVLALTATATPRVADDIQHALAFREPNVIRMSFARQNLAYVVRHTEHKDAELIHILSSVPGAAIVYTHSRRKARETAKVIADSGITATFYHAGLDHAKRNQRQQQWLQGDVRVMVATNAFGMGIDKPDVRLVIHIDPPDSVEAYFQEAGRAGRDGHRAWAVMLYNPGDKSRLRAHLTTAFPSISVIRNVYNHLAYFFTIAMGHGEGHAHMFDIERFSDTYRFFPAIVDAALHLLHNAGYIDYDTCPDKRARLRFTLQRDELYLLHDLSPIEETVVTAALRTYGGLFADLTNISLPQLAQAAGTDEDTAYIVLKAISKRGIAQFIPQTQTPTITLLTRRIPADEISMPANVYEERREIAERQISAVINYAESDQCRSQWLLQYFGESVTQPCGCCDVCNDRRATDGTDAQERIKQMLSDGELHNINELENIPLPRKQMDEGLRSLIREELVVLSEGKIRLRRKTKP